MIVTIVNQDYADAVSSGTDCISTSTLAKRRARAGRNVLLLSQNTQRKQANQYKKSQDDVAWWLTEMKAGATAHAVDRETLAGELCEYGKQFHDIVVDLPMPGYSDAATVLASSNLLVFMIRLAYWNKDKLARLQRCVKAAVKMSQTPAVLVILDEIDTIRGQALIRKLGQSIAHIRFMQSSKDNDLSLENLYRTVYLQ